MSRRRISVKDLGEVDCQGWLQRRKEGRSFLGRKWKRYWFVLQRSCLYWYTEKTAEKAEGFINLSGFTIEPAKQCRKKHALAASHPLVVTIVIAAESFIDMNRWIGKLSKAAESCDLIDTGECYSEASDQGSDECVSTSCSLDSKQEVPLTPSSRRRSISEGAALSRNRRRRSASVDVECLSWLDLPGTDGAPLIHAGEERKEDAALERPPDEMELLYNNLRAAMLSLTGFSVRRDFRATFIRRCRNDRVNEKLHLLRILSSTLKDKESALQAVEQILGEPALTAPSYRKWRSSNLELLQEMGRPPPTTSCSQEQ